VSRQLVVVAAALAAMTAMACAGSTGPSVVGVAIVGTWAYSAVQSSPSPATMTGTLQVTGQSDRGVTGSFDGVETVLSGQAVQRVGTLSGRFLDSTAVDLTLTLPTGQRQHLGRVVGDTLRGSWAVFGGSAAGDFTAVRRRP
jgi:hypothetical protein